MKPWHSADLSLWDALRLIVSLTNEGGDDLADHLIGASPVAVRTMQLSSDEEVQRACKAIRPAKARLEEWCLKGLVAMYGYVGGGSEDQALSARDWARRTPDYERSSLEGSDLPRIKGVSVSAADIRRQFEEPVPAPDSAAASLAELTQGASANPQKRRGPQPKADWPAIYAAAFDEIGRRGMPEPGNKDKKWRRQSALEHFIEDCLADMGKNLSESVIRHHAALILQSVGSKGL